MKQQDSDSPSQEDSRTVPLAVDEATHTNEAHFSRFFTQMGVTHSPGLRRPQGQEAGASLRGMSRTEG